MDSIQLTLKVYLRLVGNHKDLILRGDTLSEAFYLPLFASYLTWLRKIIAHLNSEEIMEQNEQMHCKFQFLCIHNLLFYLLVTEQFNVIDELFKNPSFAINFSQAIALIYKEHYHAKQEKKRVSKIKLKELHYGEPFTFFSKDQHQDVVALHLDDEPSHRIASIPPK